MSRLALLVSAIVSLLLISSNSEGRGTSDTKASQGQDAGTFCSKKARQKRQFIKEERDNPYSDTNLREYAKEVVPLVEAVAGRKFAATPRVNWIDPDVLARLMGDEIRLIYSGVFPEVQAEYIERMAEQSGLSLGAILGKYTPENRGVHINLDSILLAATQEGLEEQVAVDLVKLILAHELTHALQDQEVDLMEVLLSSRDEDSMNAVRGTIEGHATYIEKQVGDRLGLDEAHRFMTRMQGWNDSGELENKR
ncbi:MAG: hypothetical protein HN348_35385, partial [Proteobacteria bacterium]|nr:hypothetical protein [Pseudomonadota bacterium]